MYQKIVQEIKRFSDEKKSVVFVWGDFNVIHPGHLRLLKFASECGDVLMVGVSSDISKSAVVPQNLRLEGIRSISFVNYAFALDGPVEEFLKIGKPQIVVKGQEHKNSFNPEREVIEAYGGKIIFSSGDLHFSSIELLRKETEPSDRVTFLKPKEYLNRHSVDLDLLTETVKKFSELKVIVIGDMIVDEYINCDPLGMSQEDPTIVVTPVDRKMYIGGAGIVAAHARGLGAQVFFHTVTGCDQIAEFARKKLAEYGVDARLSPDHSRPTTLKQRYRTRGKTLLRVSEVRQHEISDEVMTNMLRNVKQDLSTADLVIFSDFNYGCLPQSLVEEICELCAERKIPMVADSQSSSQVGDVGRFRGMKLITPTEHEARIAVGDSTSGLVVLSEKLKEKAKCKYALVTLGSEGVFIHTPSLSSNSLTTDILPALNPSPKDVSGAGDSMLTTCAMALTLGANIWSATYLGSVAAACQVDRVGNTPLSAKELLLEIRQ